MSLPNLPPRHTPWSSAVYNAISRISAVYNTASAYLEAASFDEHCLRHYLAAIVSDVFSIVLLLEESATQEGIPSVWIEDIANKLTELYRLLTESLEIENQVYVVYLYCLF